MQATHTNGSGKTLKTIQKSGPDGEVTDTEGNVTTSTYDMGDRCTEVNYPASGITSFTYDALGNVLTKQTANLAKEDSTDVNEYHSLRLEVDSMLQGIAGICPKEDSDTICHLLAEKE